MASNKAIALMNEQSFNTLLNIIEVHPEELPFNSDKELERALRLQIVTGKIEALMKDKDKEIRSLNSAIKSLNSEIKELKKPSKGG